MSRFLAVVRREALEPMEGASFWVAGVVLAVLAHLTFFVVGVPFGPRPFPGLFASGFASLDIAFAWAPGILVGLVPALTMGAWAEERRSGTEELLLTWPVSTLALVAGKFTGRLLSLLLLLAAVYLPLVVAVRTLGNLDLGTVAAATVGLLWLAAACTAIATLVSACTRDQLVAFLVSTLALLGLLGLGLLARLAPGDWAERLWGMSPQAHFLETGARGLVDAGDFAHGAGIVALCLGLTWVAVERRRVM